METLPDEPGLGESAPAEGGEGFDDLGAFSLDTPAAEPFAPPESASPESAAPESFDLPALDDVSFSEPVEGFSAEGAPSASDEPSLDAPLPSFDEPMPSLDEPSFGEPSAEPPSFDEASFGEPSFETPSFEETAPPDIGGETPSGGFDLDAAALGGAETGAALDEFPSEPAADAGHGVPWRRESR